ncbi:MAG: CapA family protein, partial [Chloroflexia bacterium]
PTLTPTPLPPPASPLGLRRLWNWQAGDILTAFLAHDFDRDGRPEVAVASYDRSLYLVDAQGQERWSYDTGGSVFALAAGDLDGDGVPELIAGSEDGTVRAFSARGELLWEVALGGRVTAVAVLELQGEGRPEVLAGARPGKAYALRADGTVLWSRETPGAPTGFAGLGGIENRAVAMSTEKGAVLALDDAGIPFWREEGHGFIRGLALFRGGVVWGGRDGKVGVMTQGGDRLLSVGLESPVATVAPFDLDGDGEPEVLAGLGGEDPALVALGRKGTPLWQLPTERGVWALAFPKGSDAPTIAAGTDGGEIVLLDAWGRRRGQTWVPFRVHGLLAADLDGDGEEELLARASNHLYAFAASPVGEEGERQPFVETLPVWPEGVTLQPAGEGQVVLVAVGDICPGRAVESRMLVYGAEFPFAPLAPLLQEADIATGNLEGVLADAGEPLHKTYTFRASPDLVAGLSFAGVDVVALANNHALDFGDEGLQETLEVLRGAGIASVGAGPDPYAPVVREVKGLRIAFLARTAAIAPQDGVAWAEESELREAVAHARKQADLVVVHLHAGIEYSPHADALQRSLAQAAADGGAALVIGHHPHAPQEVEWLGSTLVVYSLGDFVFDIDDHDIARDGAILRVILSRHRVEGGEWIPVRIVDDVQPRPLQGAGNHPVVRPLPSP